MKPSKILIWVIVILAISTGTYFLFRNIGKKQNKKIEQLNNEIVRLKQEIVPIRYKIKNYDDSTLTVVVKFYDLDSNLITKHSFTMKGTTVAFDFQVVKFQNGHIAFPVKIFTDKIAPENGLKLFKYYEKGDFPEVYFSRASSNKFNDGIEIIYNKVKNNDTENLEVFGSMVQNSIPGASKDHDVYKIIVHTKGGIEIRKD